MLKYRKFGKYSFSMKSKQNAIEMGKNPLSFFTFQRERERQEEF